MFENWFMIMYLFLQAYDLHGTWSNPKKAENHAPLYERSWDKQPLNANAA